jgi:uncharacterized membrane protein YgcG
VFWERWDVNINQVDTTRNSFAVREIYDVRFDGSFTFGSVVIPLSRVESIERIEVSEEGQPLRASCGGDRGTFCVEYSSDDLFITYYFRRAAIDETRNFDIRYVVNGALRIYPDGDQLWWDAIPEEHFGFEIGSSTVTVDMPNGFAPREGVDPVVTYGARGNVEVNGRRIVATAVNGVGEYDSFSIRIQYPHNPDARIPVWQAEFDERRAYEENTQPLVNLGLLLGSVIIGVGGLVLVFARYVTKGRDPEVGAVPTFLSEPPSDLSPALVGTLLDERADLRDILSILIDLAFRGYLVIEERQEKNQVALFSYNRASFIFKRTEKEYADLPAYEQALMQHLFGQEREERTLDSLRNRFYMVIPGIQNALYAAVVDQGLFNRSPEQVRNQWSGFGTLLMIIAFGGGFISFAALEDVSGFLLCLPAALGIVGLAIASFGSAMPARTAHGALEAAKWRAFREYLTRLERYSDVESAAARFDDYLRYAVAFGINRQWLERFRGAAVDVPPWYYPTHMGPYRRGYPRTPAQSASFPLSQRELAGDVARAGDGDFSFDDVSEQMSRSLNEMSAGLTTMLDSAARVMSSRPQESGSSGSWSSGGRSFSGGGSRGGGGSGGGSRGFG